MKKNRILVIVMALTMCIGLLPGCENTANNTQGKKSVVCTIFPQYDWVREILGEKSSEYELTLLLDNGVDLHNYQPTVEDIAKIATCDIFIYVGGESDGWVEDALAEATNKDMQVINLLEVLGEAAKEEEVVEGMEHGHEHEEEHEHDEKHGDEDGQEHKDDHKHEEVEYDEHVWLSLKNTQIFVETVEKALEKVDSKNKEVFAANSEAYVVKLGELDEEYQSTVDATSKKTVLFCDRFPFRYMVDDYNLNYYAAFSGCSAETEASFETITFLAEKVHELELSSVLVIENSNQKIAKTVIGNTQDKSQNVLVMNSLQSVTNKTIDNGVTYLSIMQENLEVLKQALN